MSAGLSMFAWVDASGESVGLHMHSPISRPKLRIEARCTYLCTQDRRWRCTWTRSCRRERSGSCTLRIGKNVNSANVSVPRIQLPIVALLDLGRDIRGVLRGERSKACWVSVRGRSRAVAIVGLKHTFADAIGQSIAL